MRTEDALGNVTTRAFDAGGNKLCEKRPLGGDPLGASALAGRTVEELQSAVCTGGYLTRWTYEETSKLTGVTDALGDSYAFVYDEARNLVAKQDANGHLTTYVYDALGRRTDEWQSMSSSSAAVRMRTAVPVYQPTTPSSATTVLHWSASYDANGNAVTRTDPGSLTTHLRYGVLDRLEQTDFDAPWAAQLPLTRSIANGYDENGNLTQATETKDTAAGSVAEVTGRTFDGLDRLKTETRYDGKVVTYEYDAKGNRKKVTDPDGVATGYEYDALDRVSKATLPAGAVTYRYWPDGLEKGHTLPNGLWESRCYDAAGRLGTIVTARAAADEASCATAAVVVTRFEYGYDDDGNRTRQEERRTDPVSHALGEAETTGYGYDALDRLVGVLYAGGQALLYRLDAVGNRTGEQELSGVQAGGITLTTYPGPSGATVVREVTATFNAADWLLSRTDALDGTRSATYGYDLAGNVVTKAKGGATRRYYWSSRDTLTAVSDDGGATFLGRYDYDRSGLRVKRWAGSETVEYVLDEKYVLQEASGAVSGHPAYRRYHYGDGPLAVVDTAGSWWIGTDALGSASDLLTGSGQVGSIRKYDAWGQYRSGTAPSTGDPKLGYTGHQYDPETGLVYARARYYDGETGVFISRDIHEGSTGDAPSLHRYMYVRGNPLRYTDFDGFEDSEAKMQARQRLLQALAKNLESGPVSIYSSKVPPEMWAALFGSFGSRPGNPEKLLSRIENRRTAAKAPVPPEPSMVYADDVRRLAAEDAQRYPGNDAISRAQRTLQELNAEYGLVEQAYAGLGLAAVVAPQLGGKQPSSKQVVESETGRAIAVEKPAPGQVPAEPGGEPTPSGSATESVRAGSMSGDFKLAQSITTTGEGATAPDGFVSGGRVLAAKVRAAAAGDSSAVAEIEAAKALRSEGRNVHFQEAAGDRGVKGLRTADLLVDGSPGTGAGGTPYEVYSPETASIGGVVRGIRGKIAQSDRFILDLSRTTLTDADLAQLIGRVNKLPSMPRLVQEIIIVRNGQVVGRQP